MHEIADGSAKNLGAVVQTRGWVQTERKAHEAWAALIGKKPKAAMLLHHLVAQMGNQNAVVIGQATMARLVGCSVRTISTAITDLVSERWIQVVRIGKGKEAAYVVNSSVAWGQSRDQLYLATFHAAVIADKADQDAITLAHRELRKIPTLYPGEIQLPAGDAVPPPHQETFAEMEPDLPALRGNPNPTIREVTPEKVLQKNEPKAN